MSRRVLNALLRPPMARAPLLRRPVSPLQPAACLGLRRPQLPGARATAPLPALRFSSSSSAAPALVNAAGPVDGSALPASLADTAQSAIAVSPDSFGYLHSLGLDPGWGPTGLAQALMETVHLSGLSWAASIAAAVVVVRLLQFPFYCKLSDTTAKMKELSPLLVPLQKKMRVLQQQGDTTGLYKTRAELKDMMKRAGVKSAWMFFPFSQIPIFYGFYRALQHMSELPVPAFTEERLAWIPELSTADPFMILPLTTSALLALQLNIGGEAGVDRMSNQFKSILGIVIPIVSFGVTYSWPAALTFYFLCSAVWGVAQTFGLRNAWLRKRLGLYPLNPAAAKNPLPMSNSVNALNIASRPVPKKPLEAPRKQIGAKGGLLDRFTGANDPEKIAEAAEKAKEKRYAAYEENRKKRLEEEKRAFEAERQRRLRMKNQGTQL